MNLFRIIYEKFSIILQQIVLSKVALRFGQKITGKTSNFVENYIKKCFYVFQDEELARQLVELGYRGSGEVRI